MHLQNQFDQIMSQPTLTNQMSMQHHAYMVRWYAVPHAHTPT